MGWWEESLSSAFFEEEKTRYAAALLRFVLALRREPDAQFDEVFQRVVAETGVPEEQFRKFLEARAEIWSRVTTRG
jgi:hypothetical protein